MKVFQSVPTMSYSGGVILVAANNEQEALQLAYETSYHFQVWTYSGEYKPGYDEMTEFEVVDGLSYDTNEPKVIINSIYCE